MLLRFLLVSVVAGLGFEPPSRCEVATWAATGRAWVQARWDDVQGVRLVAERDTADAAFAGVVDELADSFSADLLAMERDRLKVLAVMAFEPMVVAEDMEPGLAYALNRVAGGLEAVAEIAGAPSDLARPVAVAVAVAAEPAGEVRATRLASAVRLTRQAAVAWMTVLRGAESATAATTASIVR